METVISPRARSLAVMTLNTTKFINGAVRNRSEATWKVYLLTALRLDFRFTLTGIIFDVAPSVPLIPVDRSCWNAPTTFIGTASLNELCRFGRSEMTYPADMGTSVGPAVK